MQTLIFEVLAMTYQNSDTENVDNGVALSKSSCLKNLARIVFWVPVFIISMYLLYFSLSVHDIFHINDFIFDIILFNVIPLLSLGSIVLGIVVGILAWNRGLAVGKYIAIGIALSLLALYPVLISSLSLITRPIAARIMCQQHKSELGIAMKHYAKAHEGRLPDAQQWCDSLLQDSNVPESFFKCPFVQKKDVRSNYAMNSKLDNLVLANVNPKTVLLFDSKPGWNQSGGPELLTIDNHPGVFRFNLPKVPGCIVLFADGSVAYVDKKHMLELRWEP
jgi:hypothetical protein